MIKPDMTQTSCRNVLSNDHMASVEFVVFFLLVLSLERFYAIKLKTYHCVVLPFFDTQKYCNFYD